MFFSSREAREVFSSQSATLTLMKPAMYSSNSSESALVYRMKFWYDLTPSCSRVLSCLPVKVSNLASLTGLNSLMRILQLRMQVAFTYFGLIYSPSMRVLMLKVYLHFWNRSDMVLFFRISMVFTPSWK